jgi:hypothetical protein
MENRFQKLFNASSIELGAGAFPKNAMHDIRQFILYTIGLSVTDELEYLHQVLPGKYQIYDPDSGVNKISEFLYEMDGRFIDNYHAFVKETLRQHFHFPFYFQKAPTIRIQTPNGNASVHYPRYHNDLMYGHPPGEINVWLPLTKPLEPEQHGFRMCDVEYSDFLMEMNPYFIALASTDPEFNDKINCMAHDVTTPADKFLAFDSRCIHSAYPMQSRTRISIDVRIIALDDFNALDKEYRGAGRMKMLYAPGHAYHELSSEEL